MRQAPQSIDAEMALLGGLLLGSKAHNEPIFGYVEIRDFYRHAHQLIYHAMLSLWEAGTPIDSITLKSALESLDFWDRVGGAAYMMSMGDIVPTSANNMYWAKIIKDKAIKRDVISASAETQALAYADEEPAHDIIEQGERALYEAGAGRRESYGKRMSELTPRAMEQMEERSKNPGALIGTTSGFKAIDDMTFGYQPGLSILAARPSMGKSSKMICNAIRTAQTGKMVGVFSLEMSEMLLTNRMLSILSGVNLRRIQKGVLLHNDLEEVKKAEECLRALPIYVDDTTGLTTRKIYSRARRMKSDMGGLDLLIIDYLSLIEPDQTGKEWNMYERVGKVCSDLRRMSKEMGVPVLCLAQISREAEKRESKRPRLSDLAESGKIEMHSDLIMFLYRGAYYEEKQIGGDLDDRPQEAEVIIAKQREGPVGTVNLSFVPRRTEFIDHVNDPYKRPEGW